MDGVLLQVDEVEREFTLAISTQFGIDEIQAFVLLRSFLYNEGLSGNGGLTDKGVVDELIAAIMPFYYSERLFVLRALIPLFRATRTLSSFHTQPHNSNISPQATKMRHTPLCSALLVIQSDNVACLVCLSLVMTTSTEVKGKHHFCSASLKVKALRMSNAFRDAFGLPLIEMGDHDTFKGEIASNPSPVSGELHILPIHLFTQPITSNVQASSSEKENSGDVKELLPDGWITPPQSSTTTTSYMFRKLVSKAVPSLALLHPQCAFSTSLPIRRVIVSHPVKAEEVKSENASPLCASSWTDSFGREQQEHCVFEQLLDSYPGLLEQL
ncbi:hypothetical protein EDD22DRAFT_1007169 [Suillus occidentalis]|nr:hypothetical protein EDD22DRAFT_1007169 [Suillus occidentalis]